jgi:hypothetical protein
VPRLHTALSVLAEALDAGANILGAVIPAPEPPKRPKSKEPPCSPCQAKAKARAYLGKVRLQEPEKPTVGRVAGKPARAPQRAPQRGPSRAPSKAPPPSSPRAS